MGKMVVWRDGQQGGEGSDEREREILISEGIANVVRKHTIVDACDVCGVCLRRPAFR